MGEQMMGALPRSDALARIVFLVLGYLTVTAVMAAIGHWLATLAGAVLLGFFLSCLLAMLHEAVHGNVCRSAAGNRFWGMAAALPLLSSFHIYRAYHIAHHKYLGTAKDPEGKTAFEGVRDYLSYLSPKYFIWELWKLAAAVMRGNSPDWLRGEDERRAQWEILYVDLPVSAGLVAATVAWPEPLLFYYWMPLFFSGAWMFLTTLHEHYQPAALDESVHTNSIQCGWPISFMLWNTNYHVGHHRDYKVHFSRLPVYEGGLTLADGEGGFREVRWPGFVAYHKAVLSDLLARPSG